MKSKPNPATVDLRGIAVPTRSLLEHLLLLGSTGTGKTTLLLSLLRQLLSQNAHDPRTRSAAVIFDVKGDLLEPVTAMLHDCGRAEDLVVFGGADPVWFNPLRGLDAARITNLLTGVSSITGQELAQRARSDELFWTNARNELLATLCEVAAATVRTATRKPVCLTHLHRLCRMLIQPPPELSKWAEDLAIFLSESATAALQSFVHLPDNTRACVATSVQGVIAPFLRPPLCALLNPQPQGGELDLGRDLFAEGKVLVVTAGQMERATEMLPAMILLKSALFTLVLSRRRLPALNQERALWVAMDEFTRLYLPHDSAGAEHIAMEMARASGTGFLLAAQNLCGLEAVSSDTLVNKLTALCRNMVFFANSCSATARLARSIFGSRRTYQEHRTVSPRPPAPLLIPREEDPTDCANVLRVPALEPVASPERLARLRTGEALVKLADGSIHTLRPGCIPG